MSVEMVRTFRPGDLAMVEGPNFSGRTDFLRTLTGLDVVPTSAVELLRPAVYVGPEIYNGVSGIAPTVRSELAIHGGDTPAIENLAEEVGLTALFDRNPVTLSGGEQAALVTIAALALRPRVLALDCALEQIEPARRRTLCSAASSVARSGTVMLVADNRFSDWSGSFNRTVKPLPVPPAARRLDVKPVSGDIDAVPRDRPSDLDLSSVSFRYVRTGDLVLRDVSAVFQPGRVYHLRGANGSGKTTLAKLMCGVLRPTAGEVFVGADRVRAWSRPGQVVAYHFQNPDVQLFCTTVNDEVGIGAANRRAATAAITAFGLDGILGNHPLDLPFVLRKRVALAATVAMGRPWLILDEPTLGQDDATSRAIAQVIGTLAAAGAGVIVISHSRWFAALLDAHAIDLTAGILTAA